MPPGVLIEVPVMLTVVYIVNGSRGDMTGLGAGTAMCGLEYADHPYGYAVCWPITNALGYTLTPRRKRQSQRGI